MCKEGVLKRKKGCKTYWGEGGEEVKKRNNLHLPQETKGGEGKNEGRGEGDESREKDLAEGGRKKRVKMRG